MEEIYGIVYTIVHPKDPGRVRYVGKTKNSLTRRSQGHWSDTNRRRSNSRLQNWLVKYKDDREMIEFTEHSRYATKDELDQAEINLIAEFRSKGQADLNITSGGDGGLGLPWSEESKAKLSETLSGEGAWKALITWEDVRDIRRRYLEGEILGQIVKDYPLSKSSMTKVLRGDTWKDPNYEPPSRDEVQRRQDPNQLKLSRGQVSELRERATQEVRSFKGWAQEYGVETQVARTALLNISHYDEKYDVSKLLRVRKPRTLRKLDEDGVRRLRRETNPGADVWRRYAKEYGMTPGAVYKVWKGSGWKGIC